MSSCRHASVASEKKISKIFWGVDPQKIMSPKNMFSRRFMTPRTFLGRKKLVEFFVGLGVFLSTCRMSKNTIFDKSSKIDGTTHDPRPLLACRHVWVVQNDAISDVEWRDVWKKCGGPCNGKVKNVENRSTLKICQKKVYRTITFPTPAVHPRDQAASNDVMMTSMWRHLRPVQSAPFWYRNFFRKFENS